MNSAVKQATICLFYTNWCPHSRHVLPLWKTFQFQFEGKIINKHQLKFISYDFTDPKWTPDLPSELCWKPNPVVNAWMKQYNITGFPTMRIRLSDNEEIEYDSQAPLTLVTLKQFVRKSLE